MAAVAGDELPPGSGPRAAEPYAGLPPRTEAPPSLAQLAGQLLDDVRSALQARAQLLVLEAQRAGMALTLMMTYAVLAALLLLTAWLALWGVLVWFLTALGAPLGVVLVVALLLSGAAAWLLLKMARAEARHLLFPATVRQLAPGHMPSATASADPTAAVPPGPPDA